MTSSNVWLSLLETPSWGWPPLPFLSLSLKHVPSKSPSLQTPPVEPSPDLLPRRPTFLRLATLKGPAQARTQIPPSTSSCAHSDDPKHTKTRLDTAATCAHRRQHMERIRPGAHRQVPTRPCTPPSYTQLTTDSEARSFQHAVLTDTHKHNHTQGPAEQRNKCKPVAYCLSLHSATAASAVAALAPCGCNPRNTTAVPPVLCTHSRASTITHGHPLHHQR